MRIALALPLLLITIISTAQVKPRARDLGIPFNGTPGKLNAITDVKGVEVGYKTLIEGPRRDLNTPHCLRHWELGVGHRKFVLEISKLSL